MCLIWVLAGVKNHCWYSYVNGYDVVLFYDKWQVSSILLFSLSKPRVKFKKHLKENCDLQLLVCASTLDQFSP